jgi:hypothetical protein
MLLFSELNGKYNTETTEICYLTITSINEIINTSQLLTLDSSSISVRSRTLSRTQSEYELNKTLSESFDNIKIGEFRNINSPPRLEIDMSIYKEDNHLSNNCCILL